MRDARLHGMSVWAASRLATRCLRSHYLTRIEVEVVVIVGTMKISLGNKLTESDAFDETFDFVAGGSRSDISVIISHPTSH